MVKDVIFGIIGGLGLFLFGMKYLSDGLQKVAGTKLRRTLRSLTQNRFRGILLGAFVTSIIQSSSVTTVMLVGLINAGIISLMQGASVVIGANIGTTITAQIIAFKIAKYALPALGIGVALMLLARKKKMQFWGQVIFAFGMIFLGLATMSNVMKPLKDVPAVTEFFVQLSTNPVLSILLATLFTVAVQSSSAAIGMVIALASVGLIDFPAALYLILGDNIGTTITAWLAALGGSISARRMACFHSLFNVVGVTYFAFLVHSGIYPHFIDIITPGAITTETIARHIANAHTFFNVFNAALFLLIMGPVVHLTQRIIPGKDIYVSAEFKYLQDKLLSTPEIAVESAKKELVAMAEMVHQTIKTAVEGFFAKDKKSIPHVQTQENAIDHLQHDITFYLAKLATQQLTPHLASQLPPLLHSINDLERISDHAVNVAELTEKVYSDSLSFSNKALAEMRTLYAKVEDMFDDTIDAVKSNDTRAIDRILQQEGEINTLHIEYRARHSQRLCENKCDPLSALIFVDFINNLEKMADHLTNIAQAARGDFLFQNDIDKPKPDVLLHPS
ncbi:MAG: Na/Pi cotransporter family protein [Candidatus Omnitrophica bacterium]|nr:Na/Pi cotransporter family protein [Candidatus Omnitrophota bacterium]